MMTLLAYPVQSSIGYFESYGWPSYGIVKPFWMTPFSAHPSRAISEYSRKHNVVSAGIVSEGRRRRRRSIASSSSPLVNNDDLSSSILISKLMTRWSWSKFNESKNNNGDIQVTTLFLVLKNSLQCLIKLSMIWKPFSRCSLCTKEPCP